ncbi:DUF7524 family protein [Halorubrum halodurans]|uniref:Uncharacterized protein n=1 Tax=Halorubrum halodurans TaxID=1383851 RepID=A0A256IPA1_9EURY|nr:hypothetical protein [Halorubrum halodurans]OYR58106.1 hypothetical protein DJ70_04160 [Halorubrum halodurans]
MSTLAVELNGDEVHSISAPDRFATTPPFSIELANRGRSTHVHLHLDDDLDRVASMADVNHYVEDDAVKRVHVSAVEIDEPVRGKLKVVTGYGSNTAYVDVRLEPPPEVAPDEVVVDERLSKPPERSPPQPWPSRVAAGLERAIERGGVPALLVSFLAVALGVVAAVAIDSVLVFLAVGFVLATTLAATLYLLS